MHRAEVVGVLVAGVLKRFRGELAWLSPRHHSA